MLRDVFSFNSDLPMDKVIWLAEGEVTTDEWGNWDITIPHKLQALPFVKGVWTTTDWATTWLTGSQRIDGQSTTDTSDVGADATNVYFSGFSDPNTKLKYKLWGVWCEGETKGKLAAFTKNLSKNKFVLNSDYNYPQLVKEGYLERGQTATHNLGFIPYCDVWAYEQIRSGVNGYRQWTRDAFGSIWGTGENVKITDSNLSLSSANSAPSKIYYRIYAS
jgi:hypothetical protein